MNWLLYALLGALLAGASPVFAKSGMRKSNSHLAAALRGTFLFIGAWFMVKMTGSGISLSSLGQNTFLYLLFSGLATGMVWICLLRALQSGEVIKAMPVVESSVALNILVGILLFHDVLTWNKIIIIVLLVAGMVMMAFKGTGKGGKTGSWLGYAVAALALTTVTMVLEHIGYAGINGYFERFFRYGVALVVVWLATFATKGYKGLRSMSFLDGVYVCLSGVTMALSWYCFYKAYALGTNATVDVVACFDLVAMVCLSCVFLRERMTVRSIFGMIFMMLGFWFIYADLPVIPF